MRASFGSVFRPARPFFRWSPLGRWGTTQTATLSNHRKALKQPEVKIATMDLSPEELQQAINQYHNHNE